MFTDAGAHFGTLRHSISVLEIFLLTYLLTSCNIRTQQAIYSLVRVGLQTVETDELTHISVITRV